MVSTCFAADFLPVMPIRLSNIRLSVDEPELALPARAGPRARRAAERHRRWRILRKSLDARDKSATWRSSTRSKWSCRATQRALVERVGAARRRRRNRALRASRRSKCPRPDSEPLAERPVVIGSGPAGAGGRLLSGRARLSAAGAGARPGRARADPRRAGLRRRRPAQSGKQLPVRRRRSRHVQRRQAHLPRRRARRAARAELLAECKGKPSILYDHRPHLGSNRLPAVVKALRQRIEALGGEFRFECRVEDLDLDDGRVRGLATSSGYIAGVGRGAGHRPQRPRHVRNAARAAACRWSPSRFRSGCASSSRRRQVNRVQYGDARLEDRLGAADYSLVAARTARSVHVLHVRRRACHAQRFRARLLLHQRHEPVDARFAVRQQRADGHARARAFRLAASAGRHAFAAPVRTAGVCAPGAANICAPSQSAEDFLAGRVRAGHCPRVICGA